MTRATTSETTNGPTASNPPFVTSNPVESKWCRYHKTNGHSSAECRVLTQKQEKPTASQGKEARIDMIQETSDYKLVQLPGKVQEKDTIILFDTGASNNCVAESFVRTLNLPIHPEPSTFVLANGYSFNSPDKVSLKFNFNITSYVTFKETFIVIPNFKSEMIL